MKPRLLAIVILIAAIAVFAWLRIVEPSSTLSGAAAAAVAATAASSSLNEGRLARGGAKDQRDKDQRFPHAVHDQAKRDELRRQILAAMATPPDPKAEAPSGSADPASAARGQRGTNDLKEFGKFVAQAIREDFIPMARECAKELKARKPDAGGGALVAFELLGDTKIGGVVNSAEIVNAKSSVHDPAFETCVRESLYGVYFDPPPAGGRATLEFDVTLAEGDAGIDEKVDDFQLKDRR